MIFLVLSGKVIFHFPENMTLPFCQKSKYDLFPKNTLKDHISGITEKYYIHPRKNVFPCDRKFKDDKKSLLSQINVGRTSVIYVNDTLNKFVIINFLSLICKHLRSTISGFTTFFESGIYLLKKKVTLRCFATDL